MKLTAEQIDHIAALARLELSEEEKTAFGRQLSSILEYIDQLGEVDTANVEPMHHSIEIHNVFGEDAVAGCDRATRDRLLGEFPEREGDLLKVNAVFS